MTLADYLKSEGLRAGHFAKCLGVHASSISRLLSGKRAPSIELMQRIAKATGGVVDANALVKNAPSYGPRKAFGQANLPEAAQ